MNPTDRQLIAASERMEELNLTSLPRPSLRMIAGAHPCALTPAVMAQLRENVLYHSTASDLRKIASL